MIETLIDIDNDLQHMSTNLLQALSGALQYTAQCELNTHVDDSIFVAIQLELLTRNN